MCYMEKVLSPVRRLVWLEQTECGEEWKEMRQRGTWGPVPAGHGPAAPSVLRAVKPFQSSEHVDSEADLSMEMSPLEGQVCLHTASGYTSTTIALF